MSFVRSVRYQNTERWVALSINSATNPLAEATIKAIDRLRGREMHMTHIPSQDDQAGLRRLGLNLTTDAELTPGGYFLH